MRKKEGEDLAIHGPMRRKEREMTDRAEMDAILNEGNLMYLALAADNVPYVVPVFYAYDGRSLYFHSARSGTKIEIMKRNNCVCFAVSQNFGVITSPAACDFEAQHRTVIGSGKAVFVEDEQEKKAALDRIVGRFSSRTFEYPESNFRQTEIVRIDIETLKGKKHGL